jgi:hypothetical protein
LCQHVRAEGIEELVVHERWDDAILLKPQQGDRKE